MNFSDFTKKIRNRLGLESETTKPKPGVPPFTEKIEKTNAVPAAEAAEALEDMGDTSKKTITLLYQKISTTQYTSAIEESEEFKKVFPGYSIDLVVSNRDDNKKSTVFALTGEKGIKKVIYINQNGEYIDTKISNDISMTRSSQIIHAGDYIAKSRYSSSDHCYNYEIFDINGKIQYTGSHLDGGVSDGETSHYRLVQYLKSNDRDGLKRYSRQFENKIILDN